MKTVSKYALVVVVIVISQFCCLQSVNFAESDTDEKEYPVISSVEIDF